MIFISIKQFPVIRQRNSDAYLTHYQTLPHFDALKIYCLQFLLFSQYFLPYIAHIFHFKCTLKCRLQFVSIWTSLKFCRLVMG